ADERSDAPLRAIDDELHGVSLLRMSPPVSPAAPANANRDVGPARSHHSRAGPARQGATRKPLIVAVTRRQSRAGRSHTSPLITAQPRYPQTPTSGTPRCAAHFSISPTSGSASAPTRKPWTHTCVVAPTARARDSACSTQCVA